MCYCIYSVHVCSYELCERSNAYYVVTVTVQWSTELQEQEKVFLEQAQLVNQWDRVLTDNGDKVMITGDQNNKYT